MSTEVEFQLILKDSKSNGWCACQSQGRKGEKEAGGRKGRRKGDRRDTVVLNAVISQIRDSEEFICEVVEH